MVSSVLIGVMVVLVVMVVLGVLVVVLVVVMLVLPLSDNDSDEACLNDRELGNEFV